MRPAFSVIFLTTLIGVGQGLFLALFTGQTCSALELLPAQDPVRFYALGTAIALVFLAGGLVASFWHLGRPERAWRTAARWRTSWLSREVIILPAMMGLAFVYGVLHLTGWDIALYRTEAGAVIRASLVVGALAALAAFALFVSTGMIYASIRFLQEWASPLTVVNYTLLGAASGFTLGAAFASHTAAGLTRFYGAWAILITVAALVTRSASLMRNARIKRNSSVQTAIGIRHSQIRQKAQGQMGGSFNTREFFHGRSAEFLETVKWLCLSLTFLAPVTLLGVGLVSGSGDALLAAFVAQYTGLVAERWLFFAQAHHPQNLYYQTI